MTSPSNVQDLNPRTCGCDFMWDARIGSHPRAREAGKDCLLGAFREQSYDNILILDTGTPEH